MDGSAAIKCPECGSSVRFSVADLGRRATKRCPKGHEFKPDARSGATVRNIQRAADNIAKRFKKPG